MGEEREEYNLAVEERAKKIRSDNLREERENIRKTLLDKQASMKDLIVNGGFLSSVRVAIKKWSLEKYRKKAINRLNQIETDLDIALKDEEKQHQRDISIEDFNKNLEESQKGKKDPENKEKDADLDYHEYTGKGLKSRYNSEIFAKLDDEKELKGFKLETYTKIEAELSKEEADLINKNEENEKDLDKIIARNKDAGKAYTKELMLEVLQKKNERERLKTSLEQAKADEEYDTQRLQDIGKERETLRKKLEKLTSEYDPKEDLESIAKGEAYYNQMAPDFLRLEEEYLSYKKRYDDHAIMDGKDLSRMFKLEKEYLPKKETYDQLVNVIGTNKQRVENYKTDKAELENSLNSLDKEELDINAAKEERKTLIDEGNRKLSSLGGFVYKHQKEMKGFDDLLRYEQKNVQYNEQLANVRSAKENLQRDILNTDVSSVMLDNFTHDKVRGIAYGGKIYLDEKQVESLDLDGPPQISDEEKNRVIETQKIVRAIKSRPIFKIMNSNAISEYMTYNEEKGDFELHENNEKESKEAYNVRLRKKYFGDDNIFHQHLLEKDFENYRKEMSKEVALKTFAFAWEKTLGFLKSSGPEMLAGKIGNETLKSATAIGREVYNIGKSVHENESTAEGKSDKEQTVADIETINDTISACLGILEVATGVDSADNPLASTMADLSLVKGLKGLGGLNETGFLLNGFNIASHVVEMGHAVTAIAKASSDAKDQKKLAEETLKRGHERFSRFLKEAVAKSKFDRTEAILDLTQTLAKDGFMAATGLGGAVVSVGSMITKAGVTAIHSHVAGKQNDKELLSADNILGGINYDKNVIKDEDFNKILQSVTGIKDKSSLAENIRVVDAIDMHRAVKNIKQNPNAEVSRAMKAIGFEKAHTFDKIKVNDILEKTSIKKGNFFTRLRNSVEQNGIHYRGVVSRWFRSLFKKTKLKGEAVATREQLAQTKQDEQLKAKHGEEELQKREGAKILYESYVKRLAEQSKTMNIKDIKTVHAPIAAYNSQLNRENVVKIFSNIPEAQQAFECKNDPLSKTKVEDLLDNAIDNANGLIKNSLKYTGKYKEPEKKEEHKEISNNNAPVV